MNIAIYEGWGPTAPFGGHQIEASAYGQLFQNLGHSVDFYVTHRPQ